MFWRRGNSRRPGRPPRRPLRQYWARTPRPTDALTGYVPEGLGLVDESEPGQVFADEIDPAWAEDDREAAQDEPAEQPER